MAVIPQFYMDAVVAIGNKTDSRNNWSATGFVVARKNEDGKYNTFLITNKHVFEDKTGKILSQNVVFRFNIANNIKAKDYDVPLASEEGIKLYTIHPNPIVDVACVLLNAVVLEKDIGQISAFVLSDNTLKRDEMLLNDIVEGSLVYSLGFPTGLVGVNTKAPLCRLGCISKIKEKTNHGYLIDIQNFPGSSGSPLINRIESNYLNGTKNLNKTNLIGILSSYIPYRDVLYSKQTGEDMQVISENSGLAIVYHVDEIDYVVNEEISRVQRKG